MGGVASCHMVVKVESHPHRPDPNAWRLHQSVGAAQSVPRSYLCACGEHVGRLLLHFVVLMLFPFNAGAETAQCDVSDC